MRKIVDSYDDWDIQGIVIKMCISCGKEIFLIKYTSYPRCDECGSKGNNKKDTQSNSKEV